MFYCVHTLVIKPCYILNCGISIILKSSIINGIVQVNHRVWIYLILGSCNKHFKITKNVATKGFLLSP